jgi:hypothetical protein
MIATTVSAIPDLLGTSPADLIDRDTNQPQVTADLARARAERIRAGLASYTQMRQDIADAYAQRDWAALGYLSWFAYVEAEFGPALRGLTRDDRREVVKDLRGQGMTTRQIAAATGASKSQVDRDLDHVSRNGTPETVTGSDGKQYPASRPVSAPPAPSTLNGQSLPPVKPEPAAEPQKSKPSPSTQDAPTPSAAVREQIENDPGVQAAEFMRRFTGVLSASVDLCNFDVDRLAQLADPNVIELLDRHVQSVTRFADAVKRARTGLHLIQGGAS